MSKSFSEIVVIGSGGGGGPVAYKLGLAGYQVTVLEKGDWRSQSENSEDELGEIHLERHRPSAEVDPTVVKSAGGDLVASASRVGQAFYLAGGGTVRYTATSWRFRPQDFKKRSTYGAVEGASLVDWPISYDELEPYYSEAENTIGVSGLGGIDPTEPRRSGPYPMPPLKPDNFQKILTKAAESLGWKPFPIPVAIHSEGNAERNAGTCMQCGWCSGFPCRFLAKSSVDTVLFSRLREKKNFSLKPLCYVTKLEVNRHKRVTGVEYIDLKTGKRESIGCHVVILAASAIQTSRLLIASGGLGNSSGQLGRNLMFHLEAKLSALFENEQFHSAYYKKVGIHDFYFPQSGDPFINHRSIQSGSKAPPISYAIQKRGYGAAFMEGVRNNFLHTQEVQCMAEDLPQNSNRVILSSHNRDPWGMPAPEIHHQYHPQDRAALMSAVRKAKQLLEAAGGANIEVPRESPKHITDRYTWHLMGTCRMGDDPASSVVNRDCQSHDVRNLFLADGSVFCSSAGINPTLTTQALSFRLGDRLPVLIKEGKI